MPPMYSPLQASAEAALSSLADLEASLLRVQLQRSQLEQRERLLIEAIGRVSHHQLSGLIEDSGMSPDLLSDLVRRTVGSSARKTKVDNSKLAQSFARKAVLKFRHPDEPALVWSGRGKTPNWIKDLERSGRLHEAQLSQVFETSCSNEEDDH